jgi:MFS family permease
MRSSNLFLAALLVAPSLSLITPLPIQSSTSATTWATTRATTRLYTVAGETVSRGGDGETDGQNDGAVSVAKKEKPLPREMMPITMGVFAQMLGEGIALSSLPLYLTRLGATPTSVGLAISCFSLAQMTFAPILVGLSSRIGRSIVLRICLAGAVASSLLIAFSGNVYGIVAGRTLAGVFAACVPVAQSGVTDMLSKSQTALGLSRVSAASQLGVVVGPAVSAIFQEGFAAMGLPAAKCLPAVFCLNSLFTLTL